jgi:hypothetical protein
MSLYLCVFAGGREVAGVEVGSYADFNACRDAIARVCEGGSPGSRFPTLMLHSDCAGEWPAAACGRLRDELATIAAEMKASPPVGRPGAGSQDAPAPPGPSHADECFVDVDGEILLQRLQELVAIALAERQPILFQ